MIWFFNAESLPPDGATVAVIMQLFERKKLVYLVMMDKMYYFYRAGLNKGDHGLLATSAVSKASFYILADTFLLPFKNSSLVLGYFFTFSRNFEGLVQLQEACVADKLLIFFSRDTKPKKLHMI